MKCKYCGYTHVKIVEISQYSTIWVACSNCERYLYEPPSYIPQQQKREYLEKYNEKRI